MFWFPANTLHYVYNAHFITFCSIAIHVRTIEHFCELCRYLFDNISQAIKFLLSFSSDSIRRKPLVASFDIGTTYTGYAYSFIKNPYDITIRKWTTEGAMSPKAPSTVLLTPELNFHSFGYEAERKFSDLCAKKEHKSWNFVNSFKMVLNEKQVNIERTSSNYSTRLHLAKDIRLPCLIDLFLFATHPIT